MLLFQSKHYSTIKQEISKKYSRRDEKNNGGKVLEYEAKTILKTGIEQGLERGLEQGAIRKLIQLICRKRIPT